MITTRCLFLFPNKIDTAALSGGSWQAGSPLTNIQNRYLRNQAESSDLLTSSTHFDIALEKSYLVRGLVLAGHDLVPDDTYRIHGSEASDFGTLVYDSGATYEAAWRSTETARQDWEADVDYRLYRPQDADISDFSWCVFHPIAAGAQARYWRVLLDATSNPNTSVKIGRVFIGGGFVLPINPAYGASIQWETGTGIDVASSGHETFRQKRPYRVLRFTIDFAPDALAFARHLEMIRRAGVDQEIFVALDPDDANDLQRRCFIGRLRQMGAVEQAMFGFNTVSYEIKELQ